MEQAFNRSFENLDLGYIDLYLMHFPEAYQRVLKDPSLDPNDVDSYQLIPKDKDGIEKRFLIRFVFFFQYSRFFILPIRISIKLILIQLISFQLFRQNKNLLFSFPFISSFRQHIV